MASQINAVPFTLNNENLIEVRNIDYDTVATRIELAISADSNFDGATIKLKRGVNIDGFVPSYINQSLEDGPIEIKQIEGSILISDYMKTGSIIFELQNPGANTEVKCVILFV